MEQIFEVENIKCGGCVNSIKTALLKLDNIDDVDINKETGSVKVFGIAENSIIIKKLNELGYPEKGDNTTIKKAKSYVSCAIGRINE